MIALVDSLLPRPRHAEDAALRANRLLRTHDDLITPPTLELAAAGRFLMAADLPGAAAALQRAVILNTVGSDPGLRPARTIGQATLLLARGEVNEARAVNVAPSAANDISDPLTEREHAVLRFLATSLSAAEIADEMCVSVNTVKTHVAAIYRKLAASRRREAVLRARELELL